MAISKIVQNSLSDTISLGPKISSVQIANSTYVVKDDTNINIGGGYIVITGSGFQSNCSVIVDSNLACSVAFVSSTQIRAELPAKPAGTYNIYLLNGDGGTAIRVNALQYSNTPTWVTTSPLASQQEDSNVSIQLAANGANTYSLQAGSTLPTGLTLSANGLISGIVNTNVSVETTFNFTVEAIDIELQETPKAFAVTISVGDVNFYRTTLLLNGDGTNGANNNVFRDSSNNNFTVTRNGNPTQGSLSPFSPAGFSNFFDGSGDYLTVPDNVAFDYGSGDFTLECWFLPIATLDSKILTAHTSDSGGFGPCNIWFAAGVLQLYSSSNNSSFDVANGATIGTPTVGQWNHMAVSRQGSSIRCFLNGVLGSTTTSSATLMNPTDTFQIAARRGGETFTGYISNFRVVKGTAVYTAAFTPSTSALTAISGTSLLTCQSNRFIDNSTNNFTVTSNGNPSVINFTPFKRTEEYSAATHGGSAYFDGGSSDYLRVAANAAFNFGSNNWTMEWWLYANSYPSNYPRFGGFAYEGTPSDSAPGFFYGTGGDGAQIFWREANGGDRTITINSPTRQWWHFAAVRDGATLRVYKNGVQIDSWSSPATIYYNNNPYTLGNSSNGSPTEPWNGYIASNRIINGTCLYPSGTTFTPPSGQLTAVANTVLLFNGTNAGIYDWTTRNVIETIGNVSINTAVTKYGTGSIRFNTPIGPKLRIPESPLTLFGTEDFTIECWYYPITKPDVAPTLISNDEVAGYPSNYWALHDRHNTDGFSGTKFSFWMGNAIGSGGPLLAGSTTVSNNNWYHLAVTRSSNTIRLFVNGTLEASNTATSASMDSLVAKPIVMGRTGYGDSGANALIDDVRITKGFARYTSSFTPPTIALPTQ
jgi:hypothetical protein